MEFFGFDAHSQNDGPIASHRAVYGSRSLESGEGRQELNAALDLDNGDKQVAEEARGEASEPDGSVVTHLDQY